MKFKNRMGPLLLLVVAGGGRKEGGGGRKVGIREHERDQKRPIASCVGRQQRCSRREFKHAQ